MFFEFLSNIAEQCPHSASLSEGMRYRSLRSPWWYFSLIIKLAWMYRLSILLCKLLLVLMFCSFYLPFLIVKPSSNLSLVSPSVLRLHLSWNSPVSSNSQQYRQPLSCWLHSTIRLWQPIQIIGWDIVLIVGLLSNKKSSKLPCLFSFILFVVLFMVLIIHRFLLLQVFCVFYFVVFIFGWVFI